MLLDNSIWIGTSSEGAVCLLPKMANRHGLISGATGTGKTVTLQVLSEAFSQLGVPVFMADVKGDLAGLAKPGELNDKIRERLETAGISHYSPRACPVTFWDIFGEKGHPVRATVSEMGPLLLARMLQLNETQSGVLHLVFKIADDENLLLIDMKDLKAMLAYAGENASRYTLNYGNITKASIGAIQRAVAVLEEQGGNLFFGEPALNINDWFVRDEAGQGMVNILAAEKLFLRPALYSAFMLWMLGELYEMLPEQGDMDLPRFVFVFDEAHLLFEDCPRELLSKIELIIRLIRSKGVGVFFCTQNPGDIPSTVLSQLGARVQHALRAFTPQEQRVIRTVAQTFRTNPSFDMETAITSLGTGEALLSFLTEDGSPSVTQRAQVLPPQSSIGFISDSLRQTIIETSDLKGKYDETFDRESAYELLAGKFTTQGVARSRVLMPLPEYEGAQVGVEQQPVYTAMTFKVFDPQTGAYVDREVSAPVPAQPLPQPAPVPMQALETTVAPPAQVPAQVPVQTPPPVLVFNPKTGQYEPKMEEEKPVKAKTTAAKEPKKEKGLAERMLENVARSSASGAGYTIGRTITRNVLGVFGIK